MAAAGVRWRLRRRSSAAKAEACAMGEPAVALVNLVVCGVSARARGISRAAGRSAAATAAVGGREGGGRASESGDELMANRNGFRWAEFLDLMGRITMQDDPLKKKKKTNARCTWAMGQLERV